MSTNYLVGIKWMHLYKKKRSSTFIFISFLLLKPLSPNSKNVNTIKWKILIYENTTNGKYKLYYIYRQTFQENFYSYKKIYSRRKQYLCTQNPLKKLCMKLLNVIILEIGPLSLAPNLLCLFFLLLSLY